MKEIAFILYSRKHLLKDSCRMMKLYPYLPQIPVNLLCQPHVPNRVVILNLMWLFYQNLNLKYLENLFTLSIYLKSEETHEKLIQNSVLTD